MEFTEAQWHGLADHARERGLLFLSSPFSSEAVELLERVGMPAWKVASGEMANLPMLERDGGHRQAGAALLGHGHVGRDRRGGRDGAGRGRAGRQCSNAPPPTRARPRGWGSTCWPSCDRRYECPVGLSDHSAGIYAGSPRSPWGPTCSRSTWPCRRELFGPDVPALAGANAS